MEQQFTPQLVEIIVRDLYDNVYHDYEFVTNNFPKKDRCDII